MHQPDPNWSPRIRPDVAWVNVDGEVVVLDVNDRALLISPSGALLWEVLDGGVSLRELADDVAQAFGLSSDRAFSEVTAFVTSMAELELLEGARESNV